MVMFKILKSGTARTQFPTTKNFALDIPTKEYSQGSANSRCNEKALPRRNHLRDHGILRAK